MKKEELIKLGVDEATAEKVAAAIADEMKSYIPKSRFDEVNEAKKQLDEEIKSRDKQLDELKKSAGDSEALKGEIGKLQEANKAAKAEYDSKVKAMQLDHAVETALINAKAKNTKAVRALLDLANAEVGEDGAIKGLDKQIEKLAKDTNTAFLFEAGQAEGQKLFGMSAPTPNPGSGDGGLSLGAQMAAQYNATVAPTNNGNN